MNCHLSKWVCILFGPASRCGRSSSGDGFILIGAIALRTFELFPARVVNKALFGKHVTVEFSGFSFVFLLGIFLCGVFTRPFHFTMCWEFFAQQTFFLEYGIAGGVQTVLKTDFESLFERRCCN